MYFTDAMLQQNCFSVNIFKLEIYGENPVRAAPRVGTVPVIGCPLDPLVIGPITQPVPLIGLFGRGGLAGGDLSGCYDTAQ